MNPEFELRDDTHDDYRLSAYEPPPRPIPRARLRMIEFAKANRGKWVEYFPHPDRDPIKLESLRTAAYKGNCSGFTGGPGAWKARIDERGTTIHFCYYGQLRRAK